MDLKINLSVISIYQSHDIMFGNQVNSSKLKPLMAL